MPLIRKKLTNTIENIFLLFILVQPILDLITSLSIIHFKSQFTAGIIIRFIIMLLGISYIFFFSNSKNKRTSIIYLFLLGLLLIMGLINNMMVKSPISVGEEIKFLFKTVYFVILFYSYLFVFKQLNSKSEWQTIVQKYFFYAMSLVGITMLLADLTNTAFNSYKYNKVGHSGWFYAGNELGAIMSICFPIIVLYAFKKTSSFKTAYYWIPTILLVYSLLAVGTKVGFGAASITLILSLFLMVIEFIKSKKGQRNTIKVNLIINAIILILFTIYIPFSPIAENTAIHLTLLKNEQKTAPPSDKKNVEKDVPENKELDKQQMENLILSGRGSYLEQQKQYFNHAPISQKLLGMGYAGNYTKQPKLIEMDFYDLFFSFGILGFILYFSPFIFFAFLIGKKVLLNLKTQFNFENVMVACGIVLGLGIAYTAGHVFTAPAVSIYLAILVAYLYMRVVSPTAK